MPPIGGKLCGNSPVTNSTVESQGDDHQTQKLELRPTSQTKACIIPIS